MHSPTECYRTILIDPPWNESGGGRIKRGADRHYSLLKTPDIVRTVLQVPEWNLICSDAHLYLWVTNRFLSDGLFVMKSLGFTYKSNFVWVKDRMGLGQYFRGQHELCLFGTRGKRPTLPRTSDRGIPSVLHSDRGKHSEKPDSSYDLIERRSDGPYMELFSRRERDGWFTWGNEV